MLTLNDGRSELWQWDTGRKLTVDADCTQVHFSNKFFGRSVDVDVVDGVAEIPDVLLQADKELLVWAFVGTAENGYTKISKVFKVNKRNKPADYVFTPTEQTTLDEIMKRLDRIEEGKDPDAIKNAVDEYLANNPIRVEEKDPTVPDWAKQPTKPKYTAQEVGAVATVNGTAPDENGNVEIEIPEVSEPDMTGYATERYVQENYQPKGNYLTKVPEGYAKAEDIPAKPEDIGAQPAGNYLTEVPSGYATEEFVKNKIAEAELGGEEVDLSGYAQKSELPTKVSQLENDSGYLTEHQDISGKLDANKLPEAINTALAQAKASGEFDGKDGKDGADGYTPQKNVDYFDGRDGVDGQDGKNGQDGSPGKDGTSPVVTVTAITGGHRITITDANGTKTMDVLDGDDGKNGKDGTSVTVKSVSESTADGGSNVVTFSDGKTLTVKNGKQGSAGKTPVRGVDYYTEADKTEIVAMVIESLGGNPVFGYVDENNNIIVSGNLPDGTYAVKYEMENGSTVNIGNLVLDTNVYYTITNTLTQCTTNNSATQAVQGGSYSATITAKSGYELKSIVVKMGGTDVSSTAVSGGKITIANVTGNIVIVAVAEEVKAAEIVNQIPLSIDTDGTVYNGIGYKTGVRIKGDGSVTSGTGISTTGFIPVSVGDTVYMKGLTFEDTSYTRLVHYDSNKSYVTVEPKMTFPTTDWTNEGNGVYSYTIANESAAYIRVASYHIMDGSEIITINQPIM